MNDFYRIIKKLKTKKDESLALATIIHVDGSAYRREGAKMLIDRHGQSFGRISAGCLEEDLIYRSKEVIVSQQPQMVTYDLRSEDDLLWGQGAGCNGKVDVWIEPVQWEQTTWGEIAHCLTNGHSVVTVTSLLGKLPVGKKWFFADGERDDVETMKLLPYVTDFKKSGAKLKLVDCEKLQSRLLFERAEPNKELYIFGAGPDVEPLVELAAKVDFTITVIDPRESRCSFDYFPHADHLIVKHPQSFFAESPNLTNTYIIVITHQFIRDQEILTYFLANPPKYLGLLGSKKRTGRLLNGKLAPAWLHSPIGVNIHAEGPEEISISILAELIKIRA